MEQAKPTPLISPRIAIFFGIIAVSTASIFIRFAQTNASSLAIAAYRLALATLILLPSAGPKNRIELLGLGKRQVGLAILSGGLLALHFATWISSLAMTTVASSVVLVTTTPLWVALLSPLLLRERIQRMVFVGLVIALTGAAVVGMSDSCQVANQGFRCPPIQVFFEGKAFLGNLLALSGAWFAAGYLMIGRNLRPNLSLLSYTALVYGAAALALLGMVAFSHTPLTGFPPITYVWLFALALIPQLMGHSTFNWALRYVPATFVSVALLGEPIGSTILAYVLLHEIPGTIKIFGGGLILIGIFIASRWGEN